MSIINKLPITKIKMSIAHLLYKGVSLFVSKNGSLIQRKAKGVNYELDIREGLDLSMYLFGGFQAPVANSPLIKIPKDAVVFDIGGNFGFMALQYAQKVPEGKVYSFEPTHYALSKFKRNLELNPELSKRINVVNAYVSDEDKNQSDIQAFSSWRIDTLKQTNEGNRHPVHLGIEKQSEGVGSITLDSFCENNDIKAIDFIKIDTDGHEVYVLKGAAKTITKYRPTIVFEVGKYVMTEKGIDFTFYLDYFGKNNYELFDVRSKKKLNNSNWEKLIPQLGTIDVIAIPSSEN